MSQLSHNESGKGIRSVPSGTIRWAVQVRRAVDCAVCEATAAALRLQGTWPLGHEGGFQGGVNQKWK